MQRNFFPFVRGVGGSASSEDQIGGNILSIFKFSRGKNQSCLKGAETSRNGIKKKNSIFGWLGGVKIQKVENSTFFIFFFFDAFPKRFESLISHFKSRFTSGFSNKISKI